MNPLPLIEVTVQLPERGKCIRQAFEVGSLLGLAFSRVRVRLVHGRGARRRGGFRAAQASLVQSALRASLARASFGRRWCSATRLTDR